MRRATDTLVAIAGSIAYSYYGEISKELFDNVSNTLPADILRL